MHTQIQRRYTQLNDLNWLPARYYISYEIAHRVHKNKLIVHSISSNTASVYETDFHVQCIEFVSNKCP